tara:strand:- start:138 stop:326 length:189 start_codon:yes stop_codon:yes gene_type:complete
MTSHAANAIRLEKELNKYKAKALMRQNLIDYIVVAIKHEMDNLPPTSHIHEVLTRINESTKL